MIKYILDTNVYIQAHNGYYNPDIVPSYWDVLKHLGEKEVIQSPKQVRDEISEKNEWLSSWKKDNHVFLAKDLQGIIDFFNQVGQKYEEVKKQNLAILQKRYSNYNSRKDEPLSDADIFVIATALFYKRHFPDNEIVIVTKENEKIHPLKSVRIPHVCKNLEIEYIDDFEFIKKVGIRFNAEIIK